MWSRHNIAGALAFAALAAAAPFLPSWLVSLATIAFANGLVVLGLVILWRAGLVPFGQALFYAAGAYTVALMGRYTGLRDVFVLVAAGALAAGLVAFLIGLLLARYRDIFFAMLSLAMSMILYGVLVKTETLGSTDGFHVETGTFLGYAPRGAALGLALFWLVLGTRGLGALLIATYFVSIAGVLAASVRDNEIRVEFLGLSVDRLIHLKVVISGVLAGLGGAPAALAVAHVDPNMAYWTTSGGFVFVTILAGAGSVAAAFVGSFVFELARSIAIDFFPGTWQLILGGGPLRTSCSCPKGSARLPGGCGAFRRGRHERHPVGARSREDIRLDRGGARHHARRPAPAGRRRHRGERRRQDHLHQHDHGPPAPDQGHHPFRGPRHHRIAVARDHAARHLALVPGGADLSLAHRIREHVRGRRDRARTGQHAGARAGAVALARDPGGGRGGARAVRHRIPAGRALGDLAARRAQAPRHRDGDGRRAARAAARRADQRHLDRGEIRRHGRGDVGAQEPQDHGLVRRARHGDRRPLRRARARLL